METIKSPCAYTRKVDGKAIASGREIARKTHDWMVANQEGFEAILGFVKSLQSSEKVGRVRDQVAIFSVDHKISVGRGYMFDNTLWAGVGRYLVLVDPSLHGAPIVFKESAVDCYGLLPVSWLPELGGIDG